MARSLPNSKRPYVQNLNTAAKAIVRELKAAVPTTHMPAFIEPLLATLRPKVPGGDGWLHEIKFDGYRLQLHKADNIIRLLTRRGHDWTHKMPAITQVAYGLNVGRAIIDGEVVVLAADGTTDFNELERELGRSETNRVVFYAFDLLFFESWDLRKVALLDRKRTLAAVLEMLPKDSAIRYSDHTEGGASLLQSFCNAGLEGVVSKRKDGRYESGRSDSWIKATCRRRDTFVIIGWARKGRKFDGFYLGEAAGRELVYAGKIESGWTDDEKEKLLALVKEREITKPLARVPDKPKAHWVRPEVLVDIEYRARTAKSGLLRHPSFKGLRWDLMAGEVRRSTRRAKKRRVDVEI